MSYWNRFREDLDKVYQALRDEESKMLFDARVRYMIDRDEDAYLDTVFRCNQFYPKKWRCLEMERVLECGQQIIIYGCGHDGRVSKRVLEVCGYCVAYWCDSNELLWNTVVEGIQVLSPESLGQNHKDCLVVIGSKQYENAIRRRLFDVGFPTKNIFGFVYNQGVANCGKQYFDLFSPRDNEIFVDAGAYNGDTLDDFVLWMQGKSYKAYAIEPLEEMCETIRNKGIPHTEVVCCAAWNRSETLFFNADTRGSSVCGRGEGIRLQARAIDEIVGDDAVTFIKMDIEGAELKALEGAKNTIVRCAPRLAVCIYHKYQDIHEIGSYLLQLNPDYKLSIRHYSSCMWETVLYAVT